MKSEPMWKNTKFEFPETNQPENLFEIKNIKFSIDELSILHDKKQKLLLNNQNILTSLIKLKKQTSSEINLLYINFWIKQTQNNIKNIKVEIFNIMNLGAKIFQNSLAKKGK